LELAGGSQALGAGKAPGYLERGDPSFE